jgi:hypothetical protein
MARAGRARHRVARPVPEVRSSRRSRRRARQRHRLAALLVVALAAVALLGLAVPRTVALVLMMPAERTLGQLRRGLPVEPTALDAAIDSGLAASGWIDSGTLWQQIGMAHLGRMRLVAADPTERADALLQAEASLQRALARRPGSAVAWWRLAWVSNALGRPGEEVTAALHLSVVTGNRVETLLFPRLRLALAKWPHLDEATRQAFEPQLVMAMRRDPRKFVTLVRRSLAEDDVRAAFRGERDLLEAYRSLLDQSLPLPGAGARAPTRRPS